ncbi:MAG TPA: hypothetical protein H9987_05935 [Candidatus Luteococcus avicola]|nr:hypothetical protein [Candidatus Luteococcus avicola]
MRYSTIFAPGTCCGCQSGPRLEPLSRARRSLDSSRPMRSWHIVPRARHTGSR